MNKEEINKELAERLGLCWHKQLLPPLFSVTLNCSCGIMMATEIGLETHFRDNNPNFFSDSGKISLLREMMKQKNWREFNELLDYAFAYSTPRETIPVHYLLNQDGLLAKAALEWLRKM